MNIEALRDIAYQGDTRTAALAIIEFLQDKAGPCKLTDNGFCYNHSEDWPCADEVIERFKKRD